MNNIYILCPANAVTGGPDALHQMAYYLNKIKNNVFVVYIGNSLNKEYETPDNYKTYDISVVCFNNIIDSSNNCVICPEVYVYYLKKFKHIKKYIWWLSVDNNFKKRTLFGKAKFIALLPFRMITNPNIYIKNFKNNWIHRVLSNKYNFNKENDVIHLCASNYAYDYVSNKTKNKVYKCIEPISKKFLDDFKVLNFSKESKKDIVLYNPAKCGKFVKKLKKRCDFDFVPLQKMTQNDLVKTYIKGKVYIDFGPFPGAERIPKEAVIYGCNILTGKHGASYYYGDVPISDDYKIENEVKNIDLVISKIDSMLKKYYEEYSDFDIYRKTVFDLEKNFIESLNVIFGDSYE